MTAPSMGATTRLVLESILPRTRHPPKNIAVDRHVADGRERQVTGDQRLATRRQFPQEIDADADRLFGVVFEAVEPVRMLEADLEHRVAGERQPIPAGRQADDAVAGS